MLKLLINRIGLGVLTLVGVSVLIFLGMEALPGDACTAFLSRSAIAETLEACRRDFKLIDATGATVPAVARYWDWFSALFQGDLGKSLSNNRPIVDTLVTQGRLFNTFFLAAYAAVIAVPLAVVLGIIAAIRQDRSFDRISNVTTLVTVSLPEFFVGYVLIALMSVGLGWFPSLSMITPSMGFGQRLYVAALPALTMVLVVLAYIMRMTRASVVNAMSSPYVEMAILKGLPQWRIVVQHALPNALAPIINVVVITLAYLVVGVIVVEVVFVYPGVGQLMVDAVSRRDAPLVQACGLFFAATYVTLNMLADVLSILSNPRLRHPR